MSDPVVAHIATFNRVDYPGYCEKAVIKATDNKYFRIDRTIGGTQYIIPNPPTERVEAVCNTCVYCQLRMLEEEGWCSQNKITYS